MAIQNNFPSCEYWRLRFFPVNLKNSSELLLHYIWHVILLYSPGCCIFFDYLGFRHHHAVSSEQTGKRIPPVIDGCRFSSSSLGLFWMKSPLFILSKSPAVFETLDILMKNAIKGSSTLFLWCLFESLQVRP